jgi:hypothetical protein
MLCREARICRDECSAGNEGSAGKQKGDARLCGDECSAGTKALQGSTKGTQGYAGTKAMQGRILCKEAKRRIREHIREVEKPNDWKSVLLAWAGFVGSLDLA